MQPLWKIVRNFLRKLKMELLFDPAIPLLGLYPKNTESSIQNCLRTPMFIEALLTIAKSWKQPKYPSVNEWVKTKQNKTKQNWYIYTMEYHEVERKKELLSFVTAWMELEGITLSELSQVVKDKCPTISPIRVT